MTRFLVEVKSSLVRQCDVSVMEREITIEDPPATFKSFVWQHFGFPAEIINGERVTDKTNTICKHCKKKMPYTAANTSTMQKHLQHHHSSLLTTAPAMKTLKGQTTLKAFASLPPVSARATAITRDIGVFIAADMRPFSVVEISATPPHTGTEVRHPIFCYLHIYFIYTVYFLCSICGKELDFSCEIVQGRSQLVEFIQNILQCFHVLYCI